MTIPFPGTMPTGWVCPKCGAVYAPTVYQCGRCAPGTNITGTGIPYVPPGGGTSGGTS